MLNKLAPLPLVLLVGAAALLSTGERSAASGGSSIVVADDANIRATSLVLDAAGNPVVSYFDFDNELLKLLHCGNASCSSGNSVQTVASVGAFGEYTSLVLDGAGNPVVAFKNSEPLSQTWLKILHCDDANCAPGGDSMTSPDMAISDFTYPSIALDAVGNPVVSYRTGAKILKLLHCNDPNCAGGDESITTPDITTGTDTSLVLDANGFPVVAYASNTTPGMKVLHCDDPNCVNDLTEVVHPGINVQWTSLALDTSGNPVIAYYDATSDDLRLVHCDDVNCDDPDPDPIVGDEISVTVDTSGNVGEYASLALDAVGNPIIAYYNGTGADLKIAYCGNPSCSLSNVITSLDTGGVVGLELSLVLDGAGDPVVSYLDLTSHDLKVLHCGSVSCAGDSDQDGCDDLRESGSNPALGGMRNPKNFWDFFDVPTGASLTRDRSVSGPDIFAVIGRFNTSGDTGIDPLSMPPASGYHTAYDRGPLVGPDPWDLGAANGSIAGTDIFAIIAQFNHSCA